MLITCLPGLGVVLGARVLGELGDDRTRFAGAKGVKGLYGGDRMLSAWPSHDSASVLAVGPHDRTARMSMTCSSAPSISACPQTNATSPHVVTVSGEHRWMERLPSASPMPSNGSLRDAGATRNDLSSIRIMGTRWAGKVRHTF